MADFARGERLRELRERKHQSQENVAYEIGVSTKSLREWEHGGKIRWDNAKKVAAFYGVDPELLVSRETPEPEEEPQVPGSQLDRIEHRLDEIYELLSGEAPGTVSSDDAARTVLEAGADIEAAADPPPDPKPARRTRQRAAARRTRA